MKTTPAISTVALTKRYGEAQALAPIDFEVRPGERVTLIGHNGSGKTTLIRMLAGMLEPSDGTAEIAGNALGSSDARAALSYLSDEPVFYDDLSVWEHLEYIARLHGTDNWEQHAVDLLDAVGLWSHEKVQVVSVDSAARIETYTMPGARGSGVICINGAAAHLIKEGERVIIMGYELTEAPIETKIALVDEKNKITGIIHG